MLIIYQLAEKVHTLLKSVYFNSLMSAELTNLQTRESIPEPLESSVASSVLSKEGWHTAAESAVEEAYRTGEPLSVLYIDANYFNDVNSELGHETGDNVIEDIRGIIAKLSDSFRTKNNEGVDRPLDIVSINPISEEISSVEISADESIDTELIDLEGGHIGGDEFAVLAHTDETGAQVIAERFRKLFAEYLEDSLHKDTLLEIGLSLAIGASTLSEDMSCSELLRMADKAMYDDKLNQLPETNRRQEVLLQLSKFVLEKSGVRPRDVPKHWRRMSS